LETAFERPVMSLEVQKQLLEVWKSHKY
jgi:hypothetical protein